MGYFYIQILIYAVRIIIIISSFGISISLSTKFTMIKSLSFLKNKYDHIHMFNKFFKDFFFTSCVFFFQVGFGALGGFNVRLDLHNGLYPTVWDSSLRMIRRHGITILVLHGWKRICQDYHSSKTAVSSKHSFNIKIVSICNIVVIYALDISNVLHSAFVYKIFCQLNID